MNWLSKKWKAFLEKEFDLKITPAKLITWIVAFLLFAIFVPPFVIIAAGEQQKNYLTVMDDGQYKCQDVCDEEGSCVTLEQTYTIKEKFDILEYHFKTLEGEYGFSDNCYNNGYPVCKVEGKPYEVEYYKSTWMQRSRFCAGALMPLEEFVGNIIK